ncbi:hypothetical protein KC19_5G171400 [Ceratodon purpureus]|uniref:Uncharacterized protein n=1 Tax=Ceratodon purpureus TaxID=3225 RepID=A0A8T0I534_CERPU|nr:hypothetical protein KC19_5G171400 [Ceratodon purpureus]
MISLRFGVLTSDVETGVHIYSLYRIRTSLSVSWFRDLGTRACLFGLHIGGSATAALKLISCISQFQGPHFGIWVHIRVCFPKWQFWLVIQMLCSFIESNIWIGIWNICFIARFQRI